MTIGDRLNSGMYKSDYPETPELLWVPAEAGRESSRKAHLMALKKVADFFQRAAEEESKSAEFEIETASPEYWMMKSDDNKRPFNMIRIGK